MSAKSIRQKMNNTMALGPMQHRLKADPAQEQLVELFDIRSQFSETFH